MDDRSFDNIIRKKAEGYADSGYDPHALTDMRQRLATLSQTNSRSFGKGQWSALSALLAFTLLNFGILWYFSEGRFTELNSELVELKAERAQWLTLQADFKEWKSTSRVDTIYLVREIVNPAAGGDPFVSASVSNSGDVNQSHSGSWVLNATPDSYLLLSEGNDLSEELTDFLVTHNLLLLDDQGHKILLVKGNSQVPGYLTKSSNNNTPLAIRLPSALPMVWNTEQLVANSAESMKRHKVSNKTLWALEKHQHSGLDFQFGLETMVTHALPSVGIGDANTSLGLLTEVIFSPALRLETGLHYGSRSYTIKEKELENVTQATLQKFSGYDSQVGQLIRLESDAQVVKIPLNLKLMGILDHNKRWYASAGISPQWLIEQEYDFQYAIENDPGSGEQSGEFRRFMGAKQDITPGFSIGTLNVGVGTEVYLNEKTRWQIGAYYEQGLEPLGAEEIKMQGVGLKTSFWLNTR